MSCPMTESDEAGCCEACAGWGGTALEGPCSDCYGTGHPHDPARACVGLPGDHVVLATEKSHRLSQGGQVVDSGN